MRKKIVILWHNGGQLANQLWLYVSVYAYCLEKGYDIENRTFFEHAASFEVPLPALIFRWLYYKPFGFFYKLASKKYRSRFRLWFLRYYKIYVKFMERFRASEIIFAPDLGGYPIYYLPPSQASAPDLARLEQDESLKNIYTDGWLFRNPEGIKKYHKEIVEYFRPRQDIRDKVDKFLFAQRNNYSHIVGVHIRQTDHQVAAGGKYFVPFTGIAQSLLKYLQFSGQNAAQTLFVVCSDDVVDLSVFKDLLVVRNKGSAVEDLYLLSQTNVVIGSDSSYGPYAAYYGDIPFIALQKNGIDWEYYRGKQNFFSNKYSTVVHY